ncbi:MAG: DUF899 domain-containing protein [Deltaproteobacteria bacterium]|nr:DUF899 domain-containing protein [Deltaproteobacteria bacterium]
MASSDFEGHRAVSRDAWLNARKALMAQEKAHTRERDRLAEARRALPWLRVEKEYAFDTAGGRESLAQLFEGRSQLLVYHFMFPASWEAGCKSCSFWADGYDGIVPHLAARDVAQVTVSIAPLAKLRAYQARMGWRFKWVSSAGSTFNRDFGVSITPEEIASRAPVYNFGTAPFMVEEAPGISVFAKNAAGEIFLTYQCFTRGLDALNPAYQLLDLVPKGRDEDGKGMAWLKRRDEY